MRPSPTEQRRTRAERSHEPSLRWDARGFAPSFIASSEPSTRLTAFAAYLELAAKPVPDVLGDDVSSVATRLATELSDYLRRLSRGRQQIRSVTG